jgi:hypothetical protein
VPQVNEYGWVLDVTFGLVAGEMLTFCPIEEDGTVITGLAVIASEPPGRMIGIFHADGHDQVERWCADNRALIDSFPKSWATKGEN